MIRSGLGPEERQDWMYGVTVMGDVTPDLTGDVAQRGDLGDDVTRLLTGCRRRQTVTRRSAVSAELTDGCRLVNSGLLFVWEMEILGNGISHCQSTRVIGCF